MQPQEMEYSPVQQARLGDNSSHFCADDRSHESKTWNCHLLQAGKEEKVVSSDICFVPKMTVTFVIKRNTGGSLQTSIKATHSKSFV